MKLNPKLPNMLNLLLILTIFIFCFACGKDDDGSLSNLPSKGAQLLAGSTDTIVYVSVDNVNVPIYLSIPKDCGAKDFPAVVVKHGSGGLWKDDNPSRGVLSSQFREWKNLLSENCMVGAFVDSYTGAGAVERSGKWDTPPETFRISTQFVRPRYANAALTFLRNLTFDDGSKVVRPKDIGILGFSDGGGAVFATLYDSSSTPPNWKWTQKYDGKEYTEADGVRAPPEIPFDGGFKGGVFYYGGVYGHGYWGGNPCDHDAMTDNIYQVYAPMQFHIPAKGYLAENALCMIDLLIEKQNPVELNLYEGVGHGFDTDEAEQSLRARNNTINWFKQLFNMK
ncbi:dienelactone hydrolase family protein [Flagellimonas sp.]|uniref:dienelactone hydrolase family protein n=1 Tax=Flagellimonas sp. TaxID=2058762 RepID=UPI003B5A9170